MVLNSTTVPIGVKGEAQSRSSSDELKDEWREKECE